MQCDLLVYVVHVVDVTIIQKYMCINFVLDDINVIWMFWWMYMAPCEYYGHTATVVMSFPLILKSACYDIYVNLDGLTNFEHGYIYWLC